MCAVFFSHFSPTVQAAAAAAAAAALKLMCFIKLVRRKERERERRESEKCLGLRRRIFLSQNQINCQGKKRQREIFLFTSVSTTRGQGTIRDVVVLVVFLIFFFRGGKIFKVNKAQILTF